MKTYKIGNLPFVFTSRKQLGPYTIFSNEGDNCILKVKTEILNKSPSLINEQNFSDNRGQIKALVQRIKTAIEDEEKQELVTVTVDNTGYIIISNVDTEEEIVIDPTSNDVENQIRGALNENGIKNFAYNNRLVELTNRLKKIGK